MKLPAEETQVEKCFECHLPKTGGAKGSLTQWISVCSCGLVELPEEQFETVDFCKLCSKRVVEARKGSFTQWVFRSDLCSCDSPEPVKRREKKGGAEAVEEQLFFAETEEEEIELVKADFPRERFKPLGILGQGAGGSVYLCRDRILNKKVALKCLNYVSDRTLVAFQAEARVNTRLDHPHIARVLDFGIHEETTPYMVVEYVNGFDLEFHLAQYGPPDLAIALDIFSQILEALTYAHSQGVLHRDVKAGNILFVAGREGKPSISVIDFGLAKVRDDTREVGEGEATLVGTPRYMSCDQARGLPYEERSEVYSLGCLAFELFTGQAPFEADTALELLRLHATEEAPSIGDVRSDREFPEGLSSLVDRCLKKEPEERFQTVEEILSALKEIRGRYKIVERAAKSPSEGEVYLSLDDSIEKRRSSGKFWLTMAMIPLSILVVAACLAFYFRLTEGSEKIEVAARSEVELVKPHSENDSELELVGEKVTFSRKEGFMHPDNILGFMDEDIKFLKGKGYKKVSFYGTSIDGSGLRYLKGEGVEELSLDHTPTGDSAMQVLSESLPDLKCLYLEYNTAVTGAGIKSLANMKALNELTLNGNKNIVDSDVETIVNNFPSLTRLSLLGTSVTDKGVVKLKKKRKLEHLYLDSTNISDRSIDAIHKLPLSQLLVSHTLITNRSLDKIATMKQLRYVSLANCRYLTASGLEKLAKRRPDLEVIMKDYRNQINIPGLTF